MNARDRCRQFGVPGAVRHQGGLSRVGRLGYRPESRRNAATRSSTSQAGPAGRPRRESARRQQAALSLLKLVPSAPLRALCTFAAVGSIAGAYTYGSEHQGHPVADPTRLVASSAPRFGARPTGRPSGTSACQRRDDPGPAPPIRARRPGSLARAEREGRALCGHSSPPVARGGGECPAAPLTPVLGSPPTDRPPR